MATVNLSEYDFLSIPDTKGMRFGIIVSEWNSEITFELLRGVLETLKSHNVADDAILVDYVPGAFELVYSSKMLVKSNSVDAVIAIGCVVRGGTPHFDYVCQGVTLGIQQLNVESSIPVIFGVLTTDDLEQAKDRAGGKHGNKGDEAAVTAIKMVAFSCKYQK